MFFDSQWRNAALRALRAAFARFTKGAPGTKAHLEVERKFALTEHEAASIPAQLDELGFTYVGTASMTDSFLPACVDGEMMRVRQEQIGSAPAHILFTYKQWVKTSTGKERKETERKVGSSTAALWKLVGRMIGGGPLLTFGKSRQLYDGKLGDADAVVSIDQVHGLGSFSGFYMEVEVLAPLDSDTAVLQDRIFALVRDIFGESRQDVKQSYMDMLVKSRQA